MLLSRIYSTWVGTWLALNIIETSGQMHLENGIGQWLDHLA
jgi:hypothetical protein